MEEQEKIIILDYSTAEVHIFPYDSAIYEDGEDFITQWDGYDFRLSEVNYMIVKSLKIEIH